MKFQKFKRSLGFTLLEVLIVTLIMGILTGIATIGYQKYVYRAHRTEAKAVLLDISQRAERFYTDNNTYSGYTVPQSLSAVPQQGTATYTVSYNAINDGQGFTVTAAPSGRQVKDTCGTLSINNIGRKTASGSPSGEARCW